MLVLNIKLWVDHCSENRFFFSNSSIFLAFHLFHFSAAAQDPKGAPDIYDPLKCTGLVEFYSMQFTYYLPTYR